MFQMQQQIDLVIGIIMPKAQFSVLEQRHRKVICIAEVSLIPWISLIAYEDFLSVK